MWSKKSTSDSGSQRHQGLIPADRLSTAMSIDSCHQIGVLKYYRKFLAMQESSLSRDSKVEKSTTDENIPCVERPATANPEP